MENTSVTQVRIENAKFGRRGLVITGCVFFLPFIIMCAIGAVGPTVFTSHSTDWRVINLSTDNTAYWPGVFTHFTPANQFFWINAAFQRYPGTSTSKLIFDVNIEITVYGLTNNGDKHTVQSPKKITRTITCQEGALACNEFYVFSIDRIAYSKYHLDMYFKEVPTAVQDSSAKTVEIKVSDHLIRSAYTDFEIAWKYVFLFVTLTVMFLPCKRAGYVLKLADLPTDIWTSQQKWVLTLLVELVLFNDPFIVFQIYTNATTSLATLYILFLSTFMCTLLYFWLCILDDMRIMAKRELIGINATTTSKSLISRATLWYHLPKFALILVIWILIVATYAYVRLHRVSDPTYDGIGDYTIKGATGVFACCMVIYVLWLLYLIVTSLGSIKRLTPPFQLIFCLTIFTIAGMLVAIFAGYLYPTPAAAVSFLSLYSLFNLYVWALAFAYAPVRDDEFYVRAEHIEMAMSRAGDEEEL